MIIHIGVSVIRDDIRPFLVAYSTGGFYIGVSTYKWTHTYSVRWIPIGSCTFLYEKFKIVAGCGASCDGTSSTVMVCRSQSCR
jgi:hypothetical protein